MSSEGCSQKKHSYIERIAPKNMFGSRFQRPSQEPKLEVPTIYKAYVRPM